ncbi:MAG: aspartate aminotransferase family protein, partial [Desulfobulbaceae bacterium]|nr:aspartate aminotransferase family protein [Desulfobulbaceae bacterium]
AAKYMPATTLNRVGSMMTNFFTADPVTDFNSAMQADATKYASFYREMLGQGIYLAPSQFEAMFVSAAHSPEDLATALEKTEWSFKKMSK